MTMPVPGGGQATLSGCLPNPTVSVSMAQQPLSASVAQSTLAGALPQPGHPGSMSQPILPNMLTSPFGLQHLSQEQLQQLAIASFGGGKKRPRDPGDDLVLVLISLPLVLSPKSQKGMIDPGNLPTKIFLVVIPSWISNINNWQNSPKFGT
eukprot:GFUD01059600.1.p2 GENE.GFUD01059600.1~~GFUD01059600.1.p2  ORF type:complete len:151 (+),score=17.65 GFUD01059600.1:3171-3623(+)